MSQIPLENDLMMGMMFKYGLQLFPVFVLVSDKPCPLKSNYSIKE